MTEPCTPKAIVKDRSVEGAAFFLASVLLLVLLLGNTEAVIRSMNDGLRLCTTTLIPTLFPFMVISELFVLGGIGRTVGRKIAKPFEALFGIGGDGACAVLLGMLCGFPIGTRCALSLYRRGRIEEIELDRILSLSNHPSSAFLLTTVGFSLFGSRAFGIRLYVVTLLSSLLLHLLRQRILPRRSQPSNAASLQNSEPRPKPIQAFTTAVSGSAIAILQICAFVVFFSVIVGCLEQVLDTLPLPQILSSWLFGCFELTGGVQRAASLVPSVAPYLCAWMVGWGGLSIHFQLINLCSDQKNSFRTYFGIKFLQATLNILLLHLSFFVFPT